MGTRHRKDIGKGDLNLLKAFSRALRVIKDKQGHSIIYRLPAAIADKTPLIVPVWEESGGQWQLAGYREVVEEAIGIEVPMMRRVVKYLWVDERTVIDTLYRLSIISVLPGQALHSAPKYKLWFEGYRSDDPLQRSEGRYGYLLEQRRALGGFRKALP